MIKGIQAYYTDKRVFNSGFVSNWFVRSGDYTDICVDWDILMRTTNDFSVCDHQSSPMPDNFMMI